MQLEDSKKILDGLAVDFPGSPYHTSADVWLELLRRFPSSQYSAAAEVKQADFAARQGEFARAIAAYDRILRAYKPEVDKPLPDLSGLSLFTNLFDVGDRLRARQRAERIDEQYRLAQHEYEFLTMNLDCPSCNNLVLREMLKIPLFEPAEERRAKLLELQKLCPKCRLAGNIAFELAMTEPRLTAEETVGGKGGLGRLELLEKVVKNYPGSNGAAEALLALADLETHLAGNRAAHLAQAIDYYKQLLEDYPKSYLAREAGEQRLMLQSQLAAAGKAGKP
jgi:tetratricopeptide (TPR) repeat protein